MDISTYSGKGRRRVRAKQKKSAAVEVNEWFLADPSGERFKMGLAVSEPLLKL
jgi:hypothetical protein